ncbi:LysR family transcriptional regulator [Vitreoscilla massiliensis]|uniref:LysR family transcriptional regulator n=1 Tax=Vitreoscilla massiliensis TaxID=1689272 RepID=A0ABY4DZH5_9NEIS|nr:LysR family transcriptional regulator [Vitreoscilla massiliensis]UOO88943.1 LysR family transcriptional regulator [Vitreoscilla massiliensis]
MFKDLPLNALRAFEATARLGEIKLAAAELYVTPAAVSQQLKKLEHSLNLNLWVRVGNKISLTTAGEQLYAICNQCLHELKQGIASLSPNPSYSSVSLQVPASFASMWLIPRLGDFYRSYPDIDVKILTSTEWQHIAPDFSIDVYIRCLSEHEYFDAAYSHQQLFNEHFGVYAAPHFNLQHKINLIAMQSHESVYDSINWSQWLQRYPHASLHQADLRYFDSEHDMIQAAISGYGLVLASNVLVSKSLEQGLLKAVFPKQTLPWHEFYYAVYRLSKQRHPAVATLLRWLQAQALKDQ